MDKQDLDITQLLAACNAASGEAGADRWFAALYDELHRIARRHMVGEAADHTLSATALTHEAYFRLSGQQSTHWKNRGHFLAVASMMMRRILVNHALARRAAKRDASLIALTLTEVEQIGTQTPRDVVALHDALVAFERIDPRASRVVEMKFFGGMDIEEIAAVLDISAPTVKRDWALARAWLQRELDAQS